MSMNQTSQKTSSSTDRLTTLLTSNFAFLSKNGINTAVCRKWLESQTPADRLILENWIDRTQKLQGIIKKAQAHPHSSSSTNSDEIE
jgi:hypothetical protein